MLDDMKRVFRRLTPVEMATRELVDAELALLDAQTAKEYATSMCTYHDARIRRLRVFLTQTAQSGQTN